MERMGRLAVALTAAVAIAFSSVTGVVLVGLWRHPPRLILQRTPEGFEWRGAGYAAKLTMRDRTLDWLMIWRCAEE